MVEFGGADLNLRGEGFDGVAVIAEFIDGAVRGGDAIFLVLFGWF